MNLFEFCLSFVYFLFWYCLFSSPSRKCAIWRNSFSILKQINIPLELESEHIWLTNIKHLSSLLTNKFHSLQSFTLATRYLLNPFECGYMVFHIFSGYFICWSLPVRCFRSSIWPAGFDCYVFDINLRESPNNRSHIILPLYTVCF